MLRILSSTAEDEEEEQKEVRPEVKQRQSFFGTLKRSFKPVPARAPGMENDLLEDLADKTYRAQKEAFYSAYSKYILVNTDSMLISFHSGGIVELLYPARAANQHAQIVGQDIFKFLTLHSQNGLNREYKSRVKSAVKMGQAVSLDLTLCTRRIMGFENFLTHWTPLKNDVNQTNFVVLTFGSLQDAR